MASLRINAWHLTRFGFCIKRTRFCLHSFLLHGDRIRVGSYRAETKLYKQNKQNEKSHPSGVQVEGAVMRERRPLMGGRCGSCTAATRWRGFWREGVDMQRNIGDAQCL